MKKNFRPAKICGCSDRALGLRPGLLRLFEVIVVGAGEVCGLTCGVIEFVEWGASEVFGPMRCSLDVDEVAAGEVCGLICGRTDVAEAGAGELCSPTSGVKVGLRRFVELELAGAVYGLEISEDCLELVLNDSCRGIPDGGGCVIDELARRLWRGRMFESVTTFGEG